MAAVQILGDGSSLALERRPKASYLVGRQEEL